VQGNGAGQTDLDVIGMRPENKQIDSVRMGHTDR
jgi:hypothetical protein